MLPSRLALAQTKREAAKTKGRIQACLATTPTSQTDEAKEEQAAKETVRPGGKPFVERSRVGPYECSSHDRGAETRAFA